MADLNLKLNLRTCSRRLPYQNQFKTVLSLTEVSTTLEPQ